ncbi:hypothetical protein HDU67_006751 [Dinochytrium kinnereticum]|nr:hypothetical protein HDU67_006751 [Dinochytrium kinnereticum]
MDTSGASPSTAMTTSVRVAVRIRPPNPQTSVLSPTRSPFDATSPPSTPTTASSGLWEGAMTTFSTVVEASSGTSLNVMKASAPQPGIAAASAVAAEGHWDFDAVYGEEANQNDRKHPPNLIPSQIKSGQTGSGKTYSMGTDPTGHLLRRLSTPTTLFSSSPTRTTSSSTLSGITSPTTYPDDIDDASKPHLSVDPEDTSATPEMGIIPRAMEEIFSAIRRDHQEEGVRHEVKVSYLELYNEEWVDLLKPAPSAGTPGSVVRGAWTMSGTSGGEQISIREDKDGKLSVVGAVEASVSSFEEAMKFLICGSRSRTTASTAMNDRSSRSHAIFTLTLKTTRPRRLANSTSPLRRQSTPLKSTPCRSSEGGGWAIMTSKFHFVDLAGSERLKRTRNTGDRKAEGIAINQGLLVLGRVIHALSEVGDAEKGPVGVNGHRTVMLACISPTESDLPETISTLRYASRARGIRNRAKVNLVLDQQQQREKDAIVAAAAATEARLLGEVAELRVALKEARERAERAEAELVKIRREGPVDGGKGLSVSSSSDTLMARISVGVEERVNPLISLDGVEEKGKVVEIDVTTSPVPFDEEDEEDQNEDVELFARYARLRDHIRQLKGLVGNALAVGSRVQTVEGIDGVVA